MSLESAQRFVVAMREDREFRYQAQMAASDEGLSGLLHKKDYDFTLRQLVAAMAACMAELDQS